MHLSFVNYDNECNIQIVREVNIMGCFTLSNVLSHRCMSRSISEDYELIWLIIMFFCWNDDNGFITIRRLDKFIWNVGKVQDVIEVVLQGWWIITLFDRNKVCLIHCEKGR